LHFIVTDKKYNSNSLTYFTCSHHFIGNNPTKKKKNWLGKHERAAQEEAIAKAEADKIKEENQLKLDLEAYQEKKPT
jgi:hypothetical protein